MGRKELENTLTLGSACQKYPILDTIVKTFQAGLALQKNRRRTGGSRKENPDLAGPLGWVPLTLREHEDDRIFPLETVSIQQYKREHDAEIEEVTIHTGPYADELTRNMNALALAIGRDIYFRNNAYQPESEEGRKVLAHELTHIAQYEEGLVGKGENEAALEEEASQAETKAMYDSDPYIRLKVGRRVYKLRKSEMKRLAELTAEYVENWLKEEQTHLSKESYVVLLCEYKEWLKEAVSC